MHGVRRAEQRGAEHSVSRVQLFQTAILNSRLEQPSRTHRRHRSRLEQPLRAHWRHRAGSNSLFERSGGSEAAFSRVFSVFSSQWPRSSEKLEKRVRTPRTRARTFVYIYIYPSLLSAYAGIMVTREGKPLTMIIIGTHHKRLSRSTFW